MEEDKNTTIVSELLEKIRFLEETRSKEKKKLEILQNDIDSYTEEVKVLKLSNNNLDKKGNKDDNDSINLRVKMLKEYIDSRLTKDSIDNVSTEEIGLFKTESSKKRALDKSKEVVIRFSPNEHYNKLFIIGDFTEWKSVLLNKSKDTFIYNTVLLKNYKYYYYYLNDSISILDHTNKVEQNSRTKTDNNVYEINDNKEKEIECFDYLSNFRQLEEARAHYNSLSMDPKDYNLLTNLILCGTKVKDFNVEMNILSEREMKNCKAYFDSKSSLSDSNSNTNKEFLKSLNSVCNIFIDRIAYCKGIFYLIKGIDIEANKLCLIQLYDKNEAKILIDYYIKKEFYIKITLSDFISKKTNQMEVEGESSLDALPNHNQIFNSSISKEILNAYYKSNKRIKVLYRKLSEKEALEQEETDKLDIQRTLEGVMTGQIFKDGFVISKRNIINKIKVEKVYVIEEKENGITDEKEVNKEDYYIETMDTMITDIRYKELNLKVSYVLEEVKAPERIQSLQIWTSLTQKFMNILHMHILNDIFISKPHNCSLCLISKNNEDYINTQNELSYKYISLCITKQEEIEDILKNKLNKEIENPANKCGLIVFFIRNFKIYKAYLYKFHDENNTLSDEALTKDIKINDFIELFFNEVRVVTNRFAKITNSFDPGLIDSLCNVNNYETNTLIKPPCKIDDLYSSKTVSDRQDNFKADALLGYCEENEPCKGLTDLTVNFDKFDTYSSDGFRLQLPICCIEFLSMNDEIKYQDKVIKEKRKCSADEILALNKLYEDSLKLDLSNIGQKEKDYVKANENKINMISTYLQQNELWIEFDKLSTISSIFDSIKNK